MARQALVLRLFNIGVHGANICYLEKRLMLILQQLEEKVLKKSLPNCQFLSVYFVDY